MRPLFVAILAKEKKIFESLLHTLEEKYFDFNYFPEIKTFFEEIEKQEYDLIVLNEDIYNENSTNVKLAEVINEENVILYSTNDEYKHKQTFFDSGGWRSAVGYLAEKRLLFFLQQMLHLENSIIPSIRRNNLFVGDLVNFSLKNLLFSSFMEKKSFQIFVISEYQHGKIFVIDGQLREAVWGKSKDIEAVMRMLFLQSGKIRVVQPRRDFEPIQNLPTILSIIHEFEFQKNMFNNWLQETKQLQLNSASLKWKQIPNYVFKNHIEQHMAESLKKPLPLETVIAMVDLMPLKTMELLHTLDDEGVLQFSTSELSGQSAGGFLNIEDKTAWLIEKLQLPEDMKSGRLLALGYNASGKSKFVSMLEGKGIQKKSVKNLETAKIEVSPEFTLHILGLSLEQDIVPVMDMLGDKINGFIFFVNCTQPDKFEYINYLINLFLNNYNVPALIALTHANHLDESGIETIKKKFSFSATLKFITLDMDKIADPWILIDELEPPVEKEEKNGEGESPND